MISSGKRGITTPTIPYVYLSSVGTVLLPLLAPLEELVDLPHQLVGQRRQIEEDAVPIDGVIYLCYPVSA